MITCEQCGKTTGQGDVGEHWICDSCKVQEPQQDNQTKDASSDKQRRQ